MEKIGSATCNLQKIVLKNISPADAYENFCLIFGGHETPTHLALQEDYQNYILSPLCEVFRHTISGRYIVLTQLISELISPPPLKSTNLTIFFLQFPVL